MKLRIIPAIIIMLTIFWIPAIAETNDGAYELDYSISGRGSADLILKDGAFALDIHHTDEKLTCRSADGEKSESFGSGRYKILVTSGAADIYYNGHFAFSVLLPNDFSDAEDIKITENGLTVSEVNISVPEEKKTKAIWDKGTSVISQTVNPTQRYDIEFMSGGQSLRVNNGYYRLELEITDKITVVSSPDGAAEGAEVICDAPAGDVYYRISVSYGLAQMYANNKLLGGWRMPKDTSAKYIERSGTPGRVIIRDHNDLYCYYDSFDRSTELPSGEYWVTDREGEKYRSLLVTAGKNSELSARVLPAERSGSFSLILGYIDEELKAYIKYDFAAQEWTLVTINTDETVEATYQAALPSGWLELHSKVSRKNLVFTCNGQEIFNTAVTYSPFGKPGFECEGCMLRIDDFSYRGENPVAAGVTEQDFRDFHTVEIAPAEDEIWMIGSNKKARVSKDGGLTWENSSRQRLTNNTLVLSSGKILSINLVEGDNADTYWDEAWVSEDGGGSFSGPFRIESRESNRITMNNKLTEISGGRVFYCAGESGHAQEKEGALGIYYTDDGGYTWSESKNNLTIFNTGVNVQEGKIVELPDGTLRCYMRTDLGFLYYSESHDRGETWDTALVKSNFVSPLCAMNIERDPYEPQTYYMVWEYDNINLASRIQRPRTRVSLAVSRDGCETWSFINDLAEFDRLLLNNWNANHGIRVTEDYIYADVLWFLTPPDGERQIIQRVWRIEKDKIKTYERFPVLHY